MKYGILSCGFYRTPGNVVIKKPFIIILLFAVTLLLAPQICFGDDSVWRGAKWGMSKSQVEKVTKIKTVEVKTSGGGYFEKKGIDISKHTFDVRFFYEDNKLSKIGIVQNNVPVKEAISSFDDIKKSLKERFGEDGKRDSRPSSLMDSLKWFSPNTTITLTYANQGSTGMVLLSYIPRKTGAKSDF